MLIGWIVALALAFSPMQTAPTPSLSPEAAALIAPVGQAIEAEKARQAALPPPADDREKLERMGVLDQVGRRAMNPIDLSVLPPEQRQPAMRALWAPIKAMDDQLMAELMTMVPEEGWFYRSQWGDQAAGAAFLIVQHSNVEAWRRFVPVLEPLVATGEVDGPSYALMFDRLAMNEGRLQRYGSQMNCVDGRWALAPLEDPANVEALRQAMGFPETLTEYTARFDSYPPCG